eukprot:CAMPEP_0206599674 /NCGR_PEP_ID=MMETSP0325_2-20121206/45313_1 /ASSEMBLY_ACC=CAM_ASM_000347 /TAXON_ID=2866 /ORGANISM="Crypthecodinium cohnii, Strain Seligo" /LENGTH=100 /DNA_ID=CAMNT_0054110777 /DNA_START=779 /DNA_END=1081 /DNA_ORIENTATION=-
MAAQDSAKRPAMLSSVPSPDSENSTKKYKFGGVVSVAFFDQRAKKPTKPKKKTTKVTKREAPIDALRRAFSSSAAHTRCQRASEYMVEEMREIGITTNDE